MSLPSRIIIGLFTFFFFLTMFIVVINIWIIPMVHLSQGSNIALIHVKKLAKTGEMDQMELTSQLEDIGFKNINITAPINTPDYGTKFSVTISADYTLESPILLLSNIWVYSNTETYKLYENDDILSEQVRNWD